MESKIIIKANRNNPIGSIQSLSYKEVDGKVNGDCTRITFNRFDKENLDYVFYNGIVAPDSQKTPLNIIIFGLFDIEVLENVWINKIGNTIYATADLIVVESVSWIADYIYKF